MSIEYWMQAKCDKCKAVIEPMQPVRATEIDPTRWGWERKWKGLGVMLGLPSLFGKRKLYCAECAGK